MIWCLAHRGASAAAAAAAAPDVTKRSHDTTAALTLARRIRQAKLVDWAVRAPERMRRRSVRACASSLVGRRAASTTNSSTTAVPRTDRERGTPNAARYSLVGPDQSPPAFLICRGGIAVMAARTTAHDNRRLLRKRTPVLGGTTHDASARRRWVQVAPRRPAHNESCIACGSAAAAALPFLQPSHALRAFNIVFPHHTAPRLLAAWQFECRLTVSWLILFQRNYCSSLDEQHRLDLGAKCSEPIIILYSFLSYNKIPTKK